MAHPLSGKITIDHFPLGYSIEGEGQAGMVIGSHIYYPRIFSQNLRQHLQLAFIDHRGFVPSPVEIDFTKFTLDTVLDDIEHIRKTLNLGRVIVIGHSGHGFMALEYAKKYPNNVSHIVLMGMGPDQSHKSQQAADQYFQDVVCDERKRMLAENLARLSDDIADHPEKRFIHYCLRLGARSWYDFHFNATSLWEGVEVNMPIMDYLWGTVFRDIDITQGLDHFDKPIFLALGLYDFLVAPFFYWNNIRDKFQNLTLRIFEKSGHTPPYEEPELFDKSLLVWLAL